MPDIVTSRADNAKESFFVIFGGHTCARMLFPVLALRVILLEDGETVQCLFDRSFKE